MILQLQILSLKEEPHYSESGCTFHPPPPLHFHQAYDNTGERQVDYGVSIEATIKL